MSLVTPVSAQYDPIKMQSLQSELAVLRSSSLYFPAGHGVCVTTSGQ